MAWSSSGKSLAELVANLKKNNIIKDSVVERTMLKVDRANYCSSDPYVDSPQGIGYGATISAPHMHAHALEILKDHLHSDAKVLDVGSGSGYLTACMAIMTSPNGKVYGVDHIAELVKKSQLNVEKDQPSLLQSDRVEFFTADGRMGLPEKAPFDVIHVGAAAASFPVELVAQLKTGGRMVVPIQSEGFNQVFEQIDKLPDGKVKRSPLVDVIYVPLTDKKHQVG